MGNAFSLRHFLTTLRVDYTHLFLFIRPFKFFLFIVDRNVRSCSRKGKIYIYSAFWIHKAVQTFKQYKDNKKQGEGGGAQFNKS